MTAASMIPFLFEGESLVRVIIRDGDPWFVGVDVCRILGITKHEQALGRLDADERGTCPIGTPGGNQSMIIASEPGLYRLIFRSSKPEAERLKRWLAHDVLPALRKTGRFDARSTVIPPSEPPEQVRDLNTNLRTVTETRQTWGVKSAQQMWLKLGMPTVPAMFEPQQQPSLFDLSGILQGESAS